MLLILIIIALLCYRNAQRAAARGLKPGPWAVYTFIAFCTGMFVASIILSFIFLAKHPEMAQIVDQQKRVQLMMDLMTKDTTGVLLYSCLMFAGGIGGHLLIRYLIDKKGAKRAS
jgi:hypothetical protein